ncbi:TPA: hypothetical protein J0U74_002833 [Enterococcus faecium]|nr:hypothetical protein BXA51_07365 [Enterococcus faecium]DAM01503.1 MAG TPA: RimK-related lysine biosynthesis protein, Probable-dependent amine/thiol ligase family Amino-group [Caudoviricetes sp.]KAF3383961.1 hypothetical protein BXA50_00270 [Enterococcus faecium]QXJ66624.1 hypothetical protein J9543_12510 [Enterococcus faecium]HAQ0787691.1 hypothetical protein [Enterococcus faecium]
MERCPRCGSEVRETSWSYCTFCGLPLKEEKNNGNK